MSTSITAMPRRVETPFSAVAPANRLVWLDITRLLCAVMILGIHWLRACYKVDLFGGRDPVTLVMNFESQTKGLGMLPYLLIAGTGHSLATWLTNLIGLLGGFGWEGVSALVIISGFSLTIALKGRELRPATFPGWFKKRSTRILVPYYLVVTPFLGAYLLLLAAVPHLHGRFAAGLSVKLGSLLHTPPLGVALSHLALFDPFAPQWQADFFAPAWWFIPAILVAYAAFPLIYAASRGRGRIPALAVAAAISMGSYYFVDHGPLRNEAWYYIVLQECFNLTLGVVVGHAWLNARERFAIERVIFGARWFPVAVLLFVVGNVANWSPHSRPIASLLFATGLLVMLTIVAKRLESTAAARIALRVDAYDVYLVHQPFAFPLALALKLILHGYAVFVGWFLFVAVAVGASLALSGVQQRLVRRPARPAAMIAA